MVELVKRYKVILLIIGIVIINLGMLLFQFNRQESIQLITNQESKTNAEKEIQEETSSIVQETPLRQEQSVNDINKSIVAEPIPTMVTTVPVYICGAVKIPGVYYVSSHAIVDEVIKLCGGFTEEADSVAINLAAPIIPNEKIIVPKVGEEIDKTITSYDNKIETSSSKTTLININTASSNELMSLPGIGEVKAQAIIQYRETIESFRTIEELKEVSGIGDKTFEKLKDLITV